MNEKLDRPRIEELPNLQTIKSFLGVIKDLALSRKPTENAGHHTLHSWDDDDFHLDVAYIANPSPDSSTGRTMHGGITLIYSKENDDLEVNYDVMEDPRQPNHLFVEKDTTTTPSHDPRKSKNEGFINLLLNIKMENDQFCSEKELQGLIKLLETFKSES